VEQRNTEGGQTRGEMAGISAGGRLGFPAWLRAWWAQKRLGQPKVRVGGWAKN
jgi:hypothetical protein